MKKSRISTLLLFCALLAGLSLLLYPTLSDYWNSLHQSRAITQYAQEVTDMNAQRYAAMLESAHQYNRALLTKADRFEMSEAEQAEYAAQLDVSGTGIIGYIEIPEIKCSLPIYHGVDEAVLQIAVGHIAGTSLPVGGESTHCVLSGHRGLPSARLFTDLDRLEEGDLFMIRVLNETLTYEVDQIRIVEPQEMGELEIEEGKDYCTLITCTPYGVNTHRLLVRGKRTEEKTVLENEELFRAKGVESKWMQEYKRDILVSLAMFLLAFLTWTGRRKYLQKKHKEDYRNEI